MFVKYWEHLAYDTLPVLEAVAGWVLPHAKPATAGKARAMSTNDMQLPQEIRFSLWSPQSVRGLTKWTITMDVET